MAPKLQNYLFGPMVLSMAQNWENIGIVLICWHLLALGSMAKHWKLLEYIRIQKLGNIPMKNLSKSYTQPQENWHWGLAQSLQSKFNWAYWAKPRFDKPLLGQVPSSNFIA